MTTLRPVGGLSPRVRGNRNTATGSPAAPRSIPACAGEPANPNPACGRRRVYPRVCGGTLDAAALTKLVGGLSPRVRGNLWPEGAEWPADRSIPACAGEPSTSPATAPCFGVYPRVCGGTEKARRKGVSEKGLSPRVRGNHPEARGARAAGRSIPACAGEPLPEIRGDCRPRVYPRVCGGTSGRARRAGSSTGLSPRVRGNRGDRGDADRALGSIPACAGEPAANPAGHVSRKVYPRVCGGTQAQAVASQLLGGLSPRVRGNPRAADL